jgi:hypothetical protein
LIHWPECYFYDIKFYILISNFPKSARHISGSLLVSLINSFARLQYAWECVLFLLQMFTSKIVSLSLLLLYHSRYYLCKPPLAVFNIIQNLSSIARILPYFVVSRPPLEDMLCVDLSYLIFRTCLALSKAMMVCMAKDLLAYTAAMAVGVFNRKVIYMLTILFIECCFWTIDLLLEGKRS